MKDDDQIKDIELEETNEELIIRVKDKTEGDTKC